MSQIDVTFQDLCRKIMREGKEYENKNRGVKRLQIPSYTLKHDFKHGFPAITNKKLYWQGIVTELLWFLRGDNNVAYLNGHGVKIWNKDAYNWYKKECKKLDDVTPMSFEQFEKFGKGSVGRNYSVQWRDFQGVDQIERLITDMEKDIMSSRLKVNAWNPAEIFETALPPCHSEFQIIGVPLDAKERLDILLEDHDRLIINEKEINEIVEFLEQYPKDILNDTAKSIINETCDDSGIPKFGFELHWNQRSVDTFLGLPFNIASYGLLAKILEYLTGYKALGIEGTLKCVHFYDNQYEAVKKLLERNPYKHDSCFLHIEDIGGGRHWDKIINSFHPSNFRLEGYSSDEAIKVDMLAPKKV